MQIAVMKQADLAANRASMRDNQVSGARQSASR
jgi:hypothetical protein